MKRVEEQTAREAKEKAAKKSKSGYQRQGVGEAMLKSVVRSVGTRLGRQIVRGLLGSIFGGR